jgi:hypothetical protein
MIGFTVQQRRVNELSKVLKGSDKKIRRQLTIAVNATSKKTQGGIAKQVATELATAQKNIKKTIKIKKKASNSEKVPQAVVSQTETKRIPLRDFGARQNKKGVSYKVSKSKGRKTIKSAFVVQSLGGHVFQRRGEKARVKKGRNAGKMKQKIFKLFGASPWGVFVKNKMKKPVVKESKQELIKQIERRIRFLKLKESGAI